MLKRLKNRFAEIQMMHVCLRCGWDNLVKILLSYAICIMLGMLWSLLIRALLTHTDNTPRAMPVHNQQRKQPRSKPEMKYLATPGGLMRCTLPEFEPSEYKGLKRNCGRPLSELALKAQKAKLKKD